MYLLQNTGTKHRNQNDEVMTFLMEIRPHQFDQDVRFACISALMLKTIHKSQILHWLLSMIYAYDHLNLGSLRLLN